MSDATWVTDDVEAHEDAGTASYAGVGVADHATGGGYLFATNELIVAAEDVDDVEIALRGLRQKTVRRDPYGARLVRLFLAPGSMKVCELVTTLRAKERDDHKPPFRVFPNHVLYGNSHGFVKGGPGDAPRPAADALATPPPPRPGSKDEDCVRVAVLDNGDFFKHPYLDGRVEGVNRHGRTSTSPDDMPAWQEGEKLPKYAGHGIFVTGLVLQHAPAAKVVTMKILDEHGVTTDIEVADAIRRLPGNVKVVLLSAGGSTHWDLGLPATEEALVELWSKRPDVQVVAPACNYGSDIPCFPAAFRGVIAVAAIGTEPGRASFSNFGNWVDACASGVSAKSTFLTYHGQVEPHGHPSTEDQGPDLDFGGWAYWSGTCFAAARVAGAIAQRIADTGEGPAEAAFRVVGDGQARRQDGACNIGVPVYPQSWA